MFYYRSLPIVVVSRRTGAIIYAHEHSATYLSMEQCNYLAETIGLVGARRRSSSMGNDELVRKSDQLFNL